MISAFFFRLPRLRAVTPAYRRQGRQEMTEAISFDFRR